MKYEESIKILTVLSAFYGEGKADAQIMAVAWHEILKEYPYHVAYRAVMNFAKNDKREYASFPTAGKIIEAIEKEQQVYSQIFNAMLNKRRYSELSEYAQKLITEEAFNEFSEKPHERKLASREIVIHKLINADTKLLK